MEVGSITSGKSTGLSCRKGQTHSEDWEWKGGEFRYLQHGWHGDFLNSGRNQSLLDWKAISPIPIWTRGMWASFLQTFDLNQLMQLL